MDFSEQEKAQKKSWFQWAPCSMNLFPKDGHGFLRPQTHPRTEFLLLLLPPLFLVGFHCEYLLVSPQFMSSESHGPVDEFSNGRKSSIAMLDRGWINSLFILLWKITTSLVKKSASKSSHSRPKMPLAKKIGFVKIWGATISSGIQWHCRILPSFEHAPLIQPCKSPEVFSWIFRARRISRWLSKEMNPILPGKDENHKTPDSHPLFTF